MSRRLAFALFVLFTLVWFGNLDYRHLIRPDEGRYAEIPREMAASGDWVTPRLNGIKYFEKPPLQYWATAAAYRLFGEHEWTARLWTALSGWLGVVLAWFAGRRLFGEKAGLLAALVLASMSFYVLAGHLSSLDMGVSFFLELALIAFLLAQTADTPARERRFMLLAWAAAAFALLSKGLIGLVLPALTLILYTLITRQTTPWRRLHAAGGLALFFLIAAPWFIAVSLANPEFPRFFFIHEHFERFLTRVHGRYHPWYDYIPLLLLGSLPWLGSLFHALWRAFSTEKQGTGTGTVRPTAPAGLPLKPRLFLGLWVVVVMVFFSLSQSKLPGYILPVFPALALLIGETLASADTASARRQLWLGAAVSGLLAGAALFLFESHAAADPALYGRYGKWLAAGGIVMLIAFVVADRLLRRRLNLAAFVTVASGGLLLAQAIVTGHESLAPLNSGYDFARKLAPLLKATDRLYCLGMYDQTLPFYLKRTCTLVDYEDEMRFGLEQEPALRGPQRADFLVHFPAARDVVVILSPATYGELRDHLPHRLLVFDREHVAIAPPRP